MEFIASVAPFLRGVTALDLYRWIAQIKFTYDCLPSFPNVGAKFRKQLHVNEKYTTREYEEMSHRDMAFNQHMKVELWITVGMFIALIALVGLWKGGRLGWRCLFMGCCLACSYAIRNAITFYNMDTIFQGLLSITLMLVYILFWIRTMSAVDLERLRQLDLATIKAYVNPLNDAMEKKVDDHASKLNSLEEKFDHEISELRQFVEEGFHRIFERINAHKSPKSPKKSPKSTSKLEPNPKPLRQPSIQDQELAMTLLTNESTKTASSSPPVEREYEERSLKSKVYATRSAMKRGKMFL
jgi:hypothetical protein